MDAKQCIECGECYAPALRGCPRCGSRNARPLKGFQATGSSPLAGRAQQTDPILVARGGIGCLLRTAAAATGATMVASFFMAWGQQRPTAVTYFAMGDLLAQKLQPLMKTAGPGVLAVFGPVLAAAYVLVGALGGRRYRRRSLFLIFGGALGAGCAWQTQDLLLKGAFGNATKTTGPGLELFFAAAVIALAAGIWGRSAEAGPPKPAEDEGVRG